MGNILNKCCVKLVDNKLSWNNLFEELETSNTYMKWSWGEYKNKFGWDIKRLQIIDGDSNELLACCQLQFKKKGFINIYLIQGGIHLANKANKNKKYEIIHEALCDYVKDNNHWQWLLFINYQSHHVDEADISLMKIGFMPILTNKMYTYLLPRKHLDKDILSLSKNWRHNLKRAQNNTDLKIEWSTSEEERKKIMLDLSVMYKGLTQRKKFKAGIDITHAAEILVSDESMLIVQAKLKDEVVAIRIASVCNDHILDLVAASNEGATKCYANYLLMWEMIKKMVELNINYFDTGGVEPSANIGVFNFKKGLNGKLALSGPLWCLGSNLFISKFARMFNN